MIASYAEYAHLLNLVNEKASCKFCDTHDIWTVAQVSRGRIGRSRRALARALSWEIFTLNRAGVLAISPAEESFFRSFVTSRVEFLPPWFDVHTRPKEPIRKDFDLVYVGSRNQLNIEGLRWFLQKVLPNFPDLTLLVVCTICDEMADEIGQFTNIKALGYIQDVGEAYQRSRAAICPMLGGAGVKVKVIEALCQGLPVIASSIVAAGLQAGFERACFLAADDEEFCELLRNLDSVVGTNESDTYARKYSREAVERPADRIFPVSPSKPTYTPSMILNACRSCNP